ncbi:MAG: hypothetical protein AB7L13_10030 [Acidimicrobiia bacterium]
MTSGSGCERVRERAEELALGHIVDPERAELLAHVDGCPDCRRDIEDLSALTDELLSLAPQLEPPDGFEGRVLTRMSGPSVAAAPRRRVGLVAASVAALAVAASAVGGYAVGHSNSDSATGTAVVVTTAPATATPVQREGDIVRADGSKSGHVLLSAEPRPYVIVTIDQPRPFTGRVMCELISSTGSARTVGSWSYEEIEQGAWATGIDPWLLTAVRMNVRDAGGNLVATAVLA